MKKNIHLFVVLFSLLSASLSGCLGGEDSGSSGYSGPIDLIVYYDTTSGMIETTVNNGQQGPTTGVEISFDYADTTSDDGNIVKITLNPDDGSTPIEADPSDNAVITYTWLTHGIFDVEMTAEDEAGNTRSITVDIRVDMNIVWTDTNTNSASMTIDAEPDCEDGLPLPDRITITSKVENPGGFLGTEQIPVGHYRTQKEPKLQVVQELYQVAERKLGTTQLEILCLEIGDLMSRLQKVTP